MWTRIAQARPAPSWGRAAHQQARTRDRVPHRPPEIMKIRSILALLSVVVLVSSTGYYFYSKRVAPWRSTQGIVCNDKRCTNSITNQKYNYWLAKAVEEGNPDLCSNVEGFIYDEELQNNKQEAQEKCKAEVTGKVGNTSDCGNIADEDQQYLCYRSSIEQITDARACDQLPSSTEDESVRHLCYTRFAIENNDISMCQKISEQGFDQGFGGSRLDCIATLAAVNGDINLCTFMSSQENFDNCTTTVALDLGNLELCDSASASAARESCTDAFSEREAQEPEEADELVQ